MKRWKILSLVAVAALLLAPASAMAKTRFSFSLNLFDCLPLLARPAPVIVAPPPPPVYMPCPPPYPVPYYEHRTVVREYHHYYNDRPEYVEEIYPNAPHYRHYPPHRQR